MSRMGRTRMLRALLPCSLMLEAFRVRMRPASLVQFEQPVVCRTLLCWKTLFCVVQSCLCQRLVFIDAGV